LFGSELLGKAGQKKKNFLFLVGIINTVVMALSFITIYTISKTRTGAAVAIQEIIDVIEINHLILIIFIIILSSLIAFFIGINLAKLCSIYISKVSYGKISYFIILFLFVINILLSNYFGIIVLIAASALGIYAINSNVRRVNLMGALLLPTIVFYLM